MLTNGDFNLGTWTRQTFNGQEYGEIFVPTGWVAWWKEGLPVPHDPENQVGYARPEMKVIPFDSPFVDPPRVFEGRYAVQLFTFWKIHQAGLYQQVQVVRGRRYRFGGYAHAWSAQNDDAHHSLTEGDAWQNMTFTLGVDMHGGTDPWAETVVWGDPAHIYDAYEPLLDIWFTAVGPQATVFVKSDVLWPFKHCDAYLDAFSLIESGPPPECKGLPREDYQRTVHVLPQGTTLERAQEVMAVAYPERQTVGFSPDDAGIGDLSVKNAILWDLTEEQQPVMQDWFDLYYGDTRVQFAGETVTYPDIVDVRDRMAVNMDSPWYPWQQRTFNEITHVFVHHSAGAASSDVATVEAIARYHTSPAGKNRPGICYTYVIGADGTVWYTSGIENVVFSQGSAEHPGDENRFGIGVCLLGSFINGAEPTGEQITSLTRLISYLNNVVGKVLSVWGHKDVIDTQCPGDSWPFKPEWGKPSNVPPDYEFASPNPLGLHVMGGCPAIGTYILETHPRVIKVFDMGSAVYYKSLWPDIITVWRHHTDDNYWYVNHSDQRAAANIWIDHYENKGLAQHLDSVDVIETVNETIGMFTGDQILRSVSFDRIFLEELHRRYPTISGEILTIPVGNPHETEFPLLLPAVEAACRYNGYIGYHAYWTAYPGANWLAEKWIYHAGRWCEMDRIFNAYDYYPRYLFSECGIVYSPSGTGNDMQAHKGWKSCGDFPTYLAQMEIYKQKIDEWNANHQNRALGGTFFSVFGNTWKDFWIGNGDILLMRDAFRI